MTKMWHLLLAGAGVCMVVILEFLERRGSAELSLRPERSASERGLPEPTEGLPWQESGKMFVSEGNVFQVEGCPFAVSEAEAKSRGDGDNKLPGNLIELAPQLGGRAGNHIMTLSSYLSMGYCCRSRLLTLPGGDNAIPSGNGSSFSAAERWFDFSNATIPWSQYRGLATDPDVCRPQAVYSRGAAFTYKDVHMKLLGCMNRVYLRGCEAAYLGDLVDTEAFCSKRDPSEQRGPGTLVMHIRSGDIFDLDKNGLHGARFGQYFVHALNLKEWNDVVILTAALTDQSVNPTFAVLEMMAKAGVLGQNVRTYKNRSLFIDVQEMLCADALVTSRSSLSFLTFPHSRATNYFVPSSCGPGSFRRMKIPPVKATFDNTTLLALEKPSAEIYGVRWREGSPDDYGVYNEWRATAEQQLEMLTYEGVNGFCRSAKHFSRLGVGGWAGAAH